MVQSLASLLEGVIDYAGLFPPAQLTVAEALPAFVDICCGPDRWIVNRFLCGTANLEELARQIEAFEVGGLEVVAIGRPNRNSGEWASTLEEDAADMNRFSHRCADVAELVAFEKRVPDQARIDACIRDVRGFDEAEVFLELPWDTESLSDSLAAISETEWLGAKARTGGAHASLFPPAKDLANFIHGCAAHDIPFKLTAGLHHPFPNVDHETGGPAHGFINALVATALALHEDLSRAEVARILLAQESEFEFASDELIWNNLSAGLDAIGVARALFVGFGSCSVAEPLADLRQSGLLE